MTLNWRRYPLKSLQALAYQRSLRGWTTVNDLYLRGRSMSWVRLEFLAAVSGLAAGCHGPILECGSGLTTEVLRRYAPLCTIVSLEQRVGWAMKTGAIYAPIDWNTGWYRWKSGPGDYSLVVVDGPDGGDRAGFLDAANIREDCTIIVDDTNNKWEGRRVVDAIEARYPGCVSQRFGNNDYNFTVVGLHASQPAAS